MSTLPEQLCRTPTWDQGKGVAEHVQISVETGIPVHFCDPRTPWKRGTNENTNGLLRQYLPRKMNLSETSQAALDEIARELNDRPRQMLDWKKPCEVLSPILR